MRQTRLEKVVKLTSFDEEERARPALAYWLSRPPAERVAAVEYLPFIGRETYLRNKLAAGRPTDLADIDALEAGHE